MTKPIRKTHELKTWPEPFDAAWHGYKTFEYRRNDRDFRVDDVLRLMEWSQKTEKYTGREYVTTVTYIANGPSFGIPDGFCVMSIDRERAIRIVP